MVDRGIEAIASDRIHGAGYLARKALGILGPASPDKRPPVRVQVVVRGPADEGHALVADLRPSSSSRCSGAFLTAT